MGVLEGHLYTKASIAVCGSFTFLLVVALIKGQYAWVVALCPGVIVIVWVVV